MQRFIQPPCQLENVIMRYSVHFKTFIRFSFLCLITNYCYGQKTELRLNAYSGLFAFRGSGSTSVTTISNSGPADEPGYYNAYPYGRKSDFSYAFEIQVQRVTSRQHLFGAGISFENLKSSLNIDSIWTQIGRVDVDGTAVLSNHFITVNPYIGQRFVIKGVTFDVQAGIDVAASIKVYEEAKIEVDKKYTYSKTHKNYPVDIRTRIQINAYYKQVGLLAGYAVGIENLYKNAGYDYLNRKAYSNFLRFGLSYRLR